MREPDLQRIRQAHRLDRFDASNRLSAFHPEDHECADDERSRHGNRMKQVAFDELRKKQTENGSGKECDAKLQHELARSRVCCEPNGDFRKPLTVFPNDREHGACLNHDLENLTNLTVEIQK